ncbi:MAG: RidA family protein [bacterium]|nr:RidA family protein [bacterium]
MKREIISTGQAPAAIGPYNQAVRAGNLIFTAGQVPLDPATMKMVDGGIREQSAQVMKNLEAVLAAAGAGFGDVVKSTCFMADLSQFAEFNDIYGAVFAGMEPPARSAFQVAALPLGALIEVEMVAIAPEMD